MLRFIIWEKIIWKSLKKKEVKFDYFKFGKLPKKNAVATWNLATINTEKDLHFMWTQIVPHREHTSVAVS